MTGRRNRAQAPKQTLACGSLPAWCLASQKAGHFPCGKSLVPPPAPLSSIGFLYGSKNGIQRISSLSKQPYSLVQTSFGCWSICLREIRDCGDSRWSLNVSKPSPAGSEAAWGQWIPSGTEPQEKADRCRKVFSEPFTKSFPAIRKPNKLIFIKVFVPLFSKSGKVLCLLFKLPAIHKLTNLFLWKFFAYFLSRK